MARAICSLEAKRHNMGKKPLKILSIDDDPGCQRVAARFLTLVGGHMVEVAGNGREGIRKATELKPDIILLDISMPDMTGLEIMESLCAGAVTHEIPVILITGASLSDTEQTTLRKKQNFVRMEQKPADFKRLLEGIEAALLPGTMRPESGESVLRDSMKPA